jgi:hypothetical protein
VCCSPTKNIGSRSAEHMSPSQRLSKASSSR